MINGISICLLAQVPEFLTNVVLHVTDVKGGNWHRQPQAILLLDQDWLIKTVLFHVVHAELDSTELHHYIIRTEENARGFTFTTQQFQNVIFFQAQ